VAFIPILPVSAGSPNRAPAALCIPGFRISTNTRALGPFQATPRGRNNTPTTKTLISKIDYNEIGQVLNKHLHSTDSLNFLQNIAYTYNERGWLLSSSAPLFAMNLYYNTLTNKAYNGNIMYQYWGTPGNITKRYLYSYDMLNRLMYGEILLVPSGTITNSEQGIGYDLNGNITKLTHIQSSVTFDNFLYSYSSGGNPTNQLQSINDVSTNNTGLVAGTTNYTYDGNGNELTQTNSTNNQQNKTFTYNLLNLPQTVVANTSTTTTTTLTYTYDATGQKLRRKSTGGNNTTDYVAGIQYDGPTTPALSFIQTEEGKAVPNGTGYDYVYYLGDNLGNTRVTFGTKTGAAVSYQNDDYYPFGLEINNSVLSPKNEYLYNKKELQEELTEYDYGARFYDPVIARWNVIDPFAEKSRRWSSYSYGEDNPIKNIDIDGDTVIVSEGSRFSSLSGREITTVDITLTGKVENDSSTPFTSAQMQGYTDRLNTAIKNDYTVSGEEVESTMTSNLTVASSTNPVQSGDNVFRVVDPDKIPDGNGGTYPASSGVVGRAPFGQNVEYISSSIVNATPATTGPNANTGKDANGGATLERTGAHEFGHTANLQHPAIGTMPGNLMNQTVRPDAGTKITPDQIKQILQSNKDGKLNQGQQH